MRAVPTDPTTSTDDVLVVPAELLGGAGQAADRLAYDATMATLTHADDARFMSRRIAETDEAYRQLIPYIVIMNAGRVLVYQRSGGGEQRLLGSVSVGWGGHVEREDQAADLPTTLRACAAREVAEELGLGEPARRTPLGMVVEHTTPVNRVHVAVVEAWHYDDVSDVTIEHGSVSLGWHPPAAAAEQFAGRFESWSEHALGLLADAQAHADA